MGSRNELRISVAGVVDLLASQSIPTSNQIISWLKEIESLRKLLTSVSDLSLVTGS